jgi:hypothetical protein
MDAYEKSCLPIATSCLTSQASTCDLSNCPGIARTFLAHLVLGVATRTRAGACDGRLRGFEERVLGQHVHRVSGAPSGERVPRAALLRRVRFGAARVSACWRCVWLAAARMISYRYR